MFMEMLRLQLKIFSKAVLKQHVILLYNGCNLKFYVDCPQWEIPWRKSILNPQIVVDFVTKMWKQTTCFFLLLKNPTIVERVESLNLKKDSSVAFNVPNIIFGKFPLSSYNKVINSITCILHVKQYIFTCILQNNMPNLCG